MVCVRQNAIESYKGDSYLIHNRNEHRRQSAEGNKLITKDKHSVIYLQEDLRAVNITESEDMMGELGLEEGRKDHSEMKTDFHFNHIYFCVCVCTRHTLVPQHARGGQRITCERWFSPSTMCVLGTEFRP